jgi:hypothetical protein
MTDLGGSITNTNSHFQDKNCEYVVKYYQTTIAFLSLRGDTLNFNKFIISILSLSLFFVLSSCGEDTTTATTTTTTPDSVTISGSMSLTGATTTTPSTIINGVALKAVTADDYKLYCVTFTDPAESCNMTVTAGVFGALCGAFAGVGFGCFATDAQNNVNPLIAKEGLAVDGGGEIQLTVVFDTTTGVGTIVSNIVSGAATTISSDALANLDALKEGILYDMADNPEDILGLPKGASTILLLEQGSPGAGSPGGKGQPPPGQGPGKIEQVYLKLYEKADGTLVLMVAREDITNRCVWNPSKDDFDYYMSDGTNRVDFDFTSKATYLESIKLALKGPNRVISEEILTTILLELEARISEQFAHCEHLQDANNNPISEEKCVFGYPNPTLFENNPGDFQAFAELGPDDIVRVAQSNTAAQGPEPNTSEPAIKRIEYHDADGKITTQEKAVSSFSFPQHLNVWCPDPFRGGQLNSYAVRLTSTSESLTASEAIARLLTGEDNQRILDDKGCGPEAKQAKLENEFTRVMHELFGHFLEEFDEAICSDQFNEKQLANIKALGQQAVDQFTSDGPAFKNFEGFGEAPEFDPNAFAPPPEGEKPALGGLPPDQQPGGENDPRKGDNPPPSILAVVGIPQQQQQQQRNHDPAFLECDNRDGVKGTYSDVDARCYMGRFFPVSLGILCSLTAPKVATIKAVADNSCMARGARIEPLCEENEVVVDSEGSKEGKGPGFKGFHCEDKLVLSSLSPAAAQDVMTLQKHILAPLFGFQSLETHTRFKDDGTGVPTKCQESFGVQMTGKLPKDGDGKTLLATDVIKGRVLFNEKNTCNERKATEGVQEGKKGNSNNEFRFIATPI